MATKKLFDERGTKKKQPGNHKYGQLTYGKHENSNIRINLRTFFGNPETEVYSIRFDNSDHFVASSNSDGSIKVFDLSSGKLSNNLPGYSVQQYTATTCLNWKPGDQGYILMSSNVDGSIFEWNIPSGKQYDRLINPCSTFAVDYSCDGQKIFAVGKDLIVRVYDEESKKIEIQFEEGKNDNPGHTNRIFAVKPHPKDKNILMTAGWDSIINIWDLRAKSWVGHFENVTVSGDSIDVKNNDVIAGCYRNEQQLLLFDWRTRQLVKQIKWDGDQDSNQAYCYSAQISKNDSKTILAGSTGQNEIKLFDSKADYKPCASVIDIAEGIYAVDYSPITNKFAFGGGQGVVYIMGYFDKRDTN